MNQESGKFKIFIVLIIVVFIILGFFIYQNFYRNTSKFKNFILIGWDGVNKKHLYELLDNGELPNLKTLLNEGVFVDTIITTGATETKPGWTEILTGYSPKITGVHSNFDYKPIPRGYTIFERLEAYFGKENIVTVFISGKDNNTGTRGPHKICLNCLTRDSLTRRKIVNIVENSSQSELGFLVPKTSGEEMIFEQREGEPYYYTKDNIDLYLSNLGLSSNIGPKAIESLEKYKGERFFLFVHFEEPDEQGHRYGEDSIEYSNGMISNDHWLGIIVSKLKKLGIYDETLIYLTTDHGFAEGGFEHPDEPNTFLATNDKAIIKGGGDRKDIAPTILSRYGFNLDEILPPLDGVSLSK